MSGKKLYKKNKRPKTFVRFENNLPKTMPSQKKKTPKNKLS